MLAQWAREMACHSTTMHLGLDTLRLHQGTQVQAWRAKPPRVVWHDPPGHCAWRNQGEQWFAMLPRQRLRMADCANKAPLAERFMACVAAWNAQAHPLQWSPQSVAKVMAKCAITLPKAA